MTVAAYLVPQVMAYAGLAGLPPVAGLWAILPALLLYSLLGSSRLLSVGPESTTALMTATVVGPLAAGAPDRYAELAAGLAVVVGAMFLVAWVARLGFLADLLSRPILVGYLTGVALIIIVDQLPKLTGVRTSGSEFFPQLLSFVRNLGEAHPATVIFSAAAIAFLFAVARFFPVSRALCWPWCSARRPSRSSAWRTTASPSSARYRPGCPALACRRRATCRNWYCSAIGVLLVGYTDVILTARAFASRGDELDPNQELSALGAANLGAGVLHGFPVSSSASRTALAHSAGGRSQAYSLVAGAVVLAVLLFLSPLLAHTPSTVLGALVVYAGVRMMDLAGFRRLAAFRRRELLLALGCLVGVLTLDILYGVLVAVGLSVAELLTRVARPHDAVEGLVPGLAGMHDVDDYPQARTVPGLLVYRYDSPLFFANAEDFKRRALAAVDRHEGAVDWFVLNTEAIVEVDITALDAVDALRQELEQRHIVFALARVKQDLRDDLDAFGLTEAIGTDRIFPTLPTARAAYREWLRRGGRHGAREK